MIEICKICRCTDNHPVFMGREIKHGDTFSYFCCTHCGCLQIMDIPHNIQKYYQNYHALKTMSGKEFWLKSTLRKQLFKYRLTGKNRFGKILAKLSKDAFEWIEPGMFDFHSSILDVGSGSGRLLLKMSHSGFSDLTGIDPFIENDIEYRTGKGTVHMEKKDIFELTGQYDVIMLHHVLEHIPDQNAALAHLVKRMHPQSKLIIHIPVMSEYIWHRLGMNGFQLGDVPRHYYIHTRKSLSVLTENHGLQLLSAKYLGSKIILDSADGKIRLQEANKSPEDIISTLVNNQDSGLACFYYRLNPTSHLVKK